MLDSDLGPVSPSDGSCKTCYGAVDIDNTNYSKIVRNSHYYLIGHMSSVVKPGAVRIGTTGYTANGITYSAFENTDGTYAFVLANNNADAKRITVSDGRHTTFPTKFRPKQSFLTVGKNKTNNLNRRL